MTRRRPDSVGGYPLTGIRVLDLTGALAGPFATRMLAAWGADVVAVEVEGGERLRLWGGAYPELETAGKPTREFLWARKRIVRLNPAILADRAVLGRLSQGADLVFEDFAPGTASTLGLTPGAGTVVSITPFGQTGPSSNKAADDVLSWAAGGLMLMTGEADRHPLPAGWYLAWHFAGIVAATYGLADYYRRRTVGGPGTAIDVSVQEIVAGLTEYYLPAFTYRGDVYRRDGLGYPAGFGVGAPRLHDGRRIYFGTLPERKYWDRLVPFLGTPDWALERRMGSMRERRANRQQVTERVQNALGSMTSRDLLPLMQEAELPVALVSDPSDVLDLLPLRERDWWEVVEREGQIQLIPGLPVSVGGALVPYRVGSNVTAPRVLDEWGAKATTAPAGGGLSAPDPLSGVRVVAFEQAQAGPLATMVLRWLGAEVIKVESETRPDLGRRVGPWPDEVKVGHLDGAGYFVEFNRGKRSVALELHEPSDLALARQLIESADLVVENFRPGTLARLGLGPDTVRSDQIYVSISGFGQAGSWSRYLAYGDTIEAFAGLMALSGYGANSLPVRPGTYIGDVLGALAGALGAVVALAGRSMTGNGRRVDASMLEATAATLAGPLIGVQQGTDYRQPQNANLSNHRHTLVRCQGEDAWVVARRGSPASLGSENASSLAKAVDGRPITDIAAPGFELLVSPMDAAEAVERLILAGYPASPVHSIASLLADPHLNARRFFRDSLHPVSGKSYLHSGPPARVAGGLPCVGQAPRLGEADPAEILVKPS